MEYLDSKVNFADNEYDKLDKFKRAKKDKKLNSLGGSDAQYGGVNIGNNGNSNGSSNVIIPRVRANNANHVTRGNVVKTLVKDAVAIELAKNFAEGAHEMMAQQKSTNIGDNVGYAIAGGAISGAERTVNDINDLADFIAPNTTNQLRNGDLFKNPVDDAKALLADIPSFNKVGSVAKDVVNEVAGSIDSTYDMLSSVGLNTFTGSDGNRISNTVNSVGKSISNMANSTVGNAISSAKDVAISVADAVDSHVGSANPFSPLNIGAKIAKAELNTLGNAVNEVIVGNAQKTNSNTKTIENNSQFSNNAQFSNNTQFGISRVQNNE